MFFRLNDEIVQLKEKWDKQIVEVSRSQVNKDIEVQTRRENEEKLRAEINQKKQDIERFVCLTGCRCLEDLSAVYNPGLWTLV